ncbi:hypothetical protein DERP_011755, partial [Dermatophagoides pteronyssinus]
LFCKKFSKNNVNIVHRTSSSSSYASYASFRSFQTSFFIWMFIVVCLGPLLSCKFFRTTEQQQQQREHHHHRHQTHQFNPNNLLIDGSISETETEQQQQ